MDNARQQIVDSIKKSSNILVTVSTDPSVDELSAALGLSIILNNLEKRATAIFSGATPPAISFLEPDKTFESSADSLRDFIIALDKEKADHLRYKVEGDVVKIFITPYKTTLSQADLEFSQGDYNVDLVVALGVKDQDHLDKALEAHGKILHDAAVMTITSGNEGSKLGSMDWHDEKASSLSEMIVGLADGIKGDGPVFDAQIATALLTGIVSATARFSNERTTSRAMTMAAQLMAAGANQQLIAAKLEEAHDITPGSIAKTDNSSSADAPAEAGSELTIERDSNGDTAKTPEAPAEEKPTPAPEDAAQQELEKELAGLNGAPAPQTGTLEDIEKELKQAADELPGAAVPAESGDVNTPAAPDQPQIQAIPSEPATVEPIPGITPASESPDAFVVPPVPLISPATVDPSSIPVSPQIVNEHGKMSTEPPEGTPPINSIQDNPNDGEPATIDPFNAPVTPQEVPAVAPVASDVPPVPVLPPMPDLSPVAPVLPTTNLGTPEGAAILGSSQDPVTPAPQATPIDVPQLPPLPPLPADLAMPPLPPPPPPPPTLGQSPTSMPSGAVSGDVFGDGADTTPPAPTTPPEPGQFKIPGQ